MRYLRTWRSLALFLAVNLVLTTFLPTISYALTTGPSAPEVQSFSPIGMTDMVDPFTGDFSYNLPLLDVGGYPINLTYNAGITPEQEASWVGLGWNINPGAINRTMRGLPDDFKGDVVKKTFNMKPNQTYTVSGSIKPELFGFDAKKAGGLKIKIGTSFFYNNYNGFGTSLNATPSLGVGSSNSSGLNVGLGLSSSSEDGFSVSPSVSYSTTMKAKDKEQGFGLSIGATINSREGLRDISFSRSGTDKKTQMGATKTGTYSFAIPSYTPTIDMNMWNMNIGGAFDAGPEVFGSSPIFGVGISYSGQFLSDIHKNTPAFGYYYAQNASLGSSLQDFNREKDGAFSKKTPNLPLAMQTFDLFQTTGQGFSGLFRLHRSDIGVVGDPSASNTSGSGNLSVETAAGNAVHVGVDLQTVTSTTFTNPWNNLITNTYAFRKNIPYDGYEPAFFKNASNMAPETSFDDFFESKMGGFAPLESQMSAYGSYSDILGVNKFNGSVTASGIQLYREKRPSKTDLIQAFTAKEAADLGFKAEYYEYNKFRTASKNEYKVVENPINESRKPHHFFRFAATTSDGSRYVYGLPAYNHIQKEITFSVDQKNTSEENDEINPLVSYDNDNKSTQNKGGIDNYYNEMVTPSYAHSFLLTQVLSHDYIDNDNTPGPSDGDAGNYTKINYSRLHNDYQWRTPYTSTSMVAALNKGVNSLDSDNKANIVYGTKDVLLINSIESRTQVAEFYISQREDGREAYSEDGGVGSQKSYKLDKIVLYSKHDRYLNTNPEPIKTVHFVYNYDLCQGTTNSTATGKGKLTLKKVFFTYGRSEKGVLNPYEFNYSNNPAFDIKATDRWGAYKGQAESPKINEKEPVNCVINPYALQDKTLADKNASAWNLTSIKLPTGGEIKVTYEADDYGYVQNKRAMHMFPVTSNGVVIPSSMMTPNLKANDFLLDSRVHFRYAMKMGKDGNRKEEIISGYGNVITNGSDKAALIGNTLTIPFDLVKFDRTGTESSPMMRAACQFALKNNPRAINNGSINAESGALKQIGFALLKRISSISEMFSSPNTRARNEMGIGSFEPYRSFVRLHVPKGANKIGGGHRVKTLTISDNWVNLSGSTKEKIYGTAYAYTLPSSSESSGVASYEPIIGGEENPFRQPVGISNDPDLPLGPKNEFYQEEPFGEFAFPSPQVGYGRVTMSSIVPAGVVSNATGTTVKEFYTAKDFPVITSRTGMDARQVRPSAVLKLLRINTSEYFTASQGFYIELNDMHGKQKGEYTYPQNSTTYNTATEFFYSQKAEPVNVVNSAGKDVSFNINGLNNKVWVADKDPVNNEFYSQQNVGVDMDMVIDTRESVTETQALGAYVQTDAFLIPFLPPIPVIVPVPLPNSHNEINRFRSTTFTKIVNRKGILETVRKKVDGSTNTVTNLVYDAQTGQAISTRTLNQYGDNVYSFNYPAHWAYDGLGPAWKNQGIRLTDVDFSNSILGLFTPGDELLVNEGNGVGIRAFVTEVNGSAVVVRRNDNTLITKAKNVYIFRSGRKNRLMESMASVSTLSNPLVDKTRLIFQQVLDAQAMEYDDNWPQFCECNTVNKDNPYLRGAKGQFRPKRSYVLLDNRIASKKNNTPKLRTDGVYASFVPFWTYVGNAWTASGKNNWTLKTETTIVNPRGEEVETRDAINRFTSATFGYKHTLLISVAQNSQYHDHGYDGFEDYKISSCEDQHFSFKNSLILKDGVNVLNDGVNAEAIGGSKILPWLNSADSHTGKYSILVPNGKKLELRKVIEECSE